VFGLLTKRSFAGDDVYEEDVGFQVKWLYSHISPRDHFCKYNFRSGEVLLELNEEAFDIFLSQTFASQ